MNRENYHQHCMTLVKAEDYDRYLLSLFMPEEKQAGIWAIFAFNIEIAKTREQVSDPMLAEIRLQWWQNALNKLADDKTEDHPICQALAGAKKQGTVSFNLCTDMIKARQNDLSVATCSSLEQLINYTSATAGALHEFALRYLVSEPSIDTLKATRQSGTAWGLIGIVRAIGFQAQLNQNDLPSELLAEMDIDDSTVFKGEMLPALWDVVDKMLDAAEGLINDSRVQRKSVDKNAIPLLAINRLSEAYIKQLRNRALNPYQQLATHGAGPKAMFNLLLANIFGKF